MFNTQISSDLNPVDHLRDMLDALEAPPHNIQDFRGLVESMPR